MDFAARSKVNSSWFNVFAAVVAASAMQIITTRCESLLQRYAVVMHLTWHLKLYYCEEFVNIVNLPILSVAELNICSYTELPYSELTESRFHYSDYPSQIYPIQNYLETYSLEYEIGGLSAVRLFPSTDTLKQRAGTK